MIPEENQESKEPTRDAMIRWQGYARESRTAVNSHFLAYSSAILALQTTTLLDSEIKTIDSPYLFTAGGALAMTSLILGSIAVLVRLRDARLTARIARYKYKNRTKEEIKKLRTEANCYGAWTNRLIPLQVIFFSISAISFGAWVVITSSEKL